MNKNKSNLFEQIISIPNIEGAYLDISERFLAQNKTFKYKGLDDLSINDTIHNSSEIIFEIQNELIDKKAIRPLLRHIIPKKSGKKRTVHSCSIKDRIKSQAIYRIIEPLIEERLSPYLFSYRSLHPSYYAARSVARRYKRHFDEDWVIVRDVKDYAENLQHEILINKLLEINIPLDVIDLLKLFIEAPVFKKGSASKPSPQIGLLQGIPLVPLFLNLYLNELDIELGKSVSLYRRVGDDMIIFDKSETKVLNISLKIDEYFERHGLKSSTEKSKLIKSSEAFEFLGYHFENKSIAISQNSVDKIYKAWQQKIRPDKVHKKHLKDNLENTNHIQDIKQLYSVFYKHDNSIEKDFLMILQQYPLADSDKQAQEMTKYLWKLVTKKITGKCTPRSQRIAQNVLKDLNVNLPSFFKYYLNKKTGYEKGKK